MSMIKLFTTNIGWDGERTISEQRLGDELSEKQIQDLFEGNLYELLGVKLLKSEFPVPDSRGMNKRIDTLGIDDNGNPVIIEYKITQKALVVSQAISYGRSLRKNKSAFELERIKKFPHWRGREINWSGQKLICIAPSFSEHDRDTAKEYRESNGKNSIQLIRFKLFGNDLIHLEFLDTKPQDSRLHEESNQPSSEVIKATHTRSKLQRSKIDTTKYSLWIDGRLIGQKLPKNHLPFETFRFLVEKKGKYLTENGIEAEELQDHFGMHVGRLLIDIPGRIEDEENFERLASKVEKNRNRTFQRTRWFWRRKQLIVREIYGEIRTFAFHSNWARGEWEKAMKKLQKAHSYLKIQYKPTDE